jgi:hypothetical protein
MGTQLLACKTLGQRGWFNIVNGGIVVDFYRRLQTVSVYSRTLEKSRHPAGSPPKLRIRGIAVQSSVEVTEGVLCIFEHPGVVKHRGCRVVFRRCAYFMSDTVNQKLASILVGEVQSLRQAARCSIGFGNRGLKSWRKGDGRFDNDERFGLPLCPIVVGRRLWVFEDLRVEKRLVCIGCFVEEARALCMEFQGRLEEFKCIVNLETTPPC